jgi:hypothetical protein
LLFMGGSFMKTTQKWSRMFGMVLAFGLVLAGCGDKDSGDPTSPSGGGSGGNLVVYNYSATPIGIQTCTSADTANNILAGPYSESMSVQAYGSALKQLTPGNYDIRTIVGGVPLTPLNGLITANGLEVVYNGTALTFVLKNLPTPASAVSLTIKNTSTDPIIRVSITVGTTTSESYAGIAANGSYTWPNLDMGTAYTVTIYSRSTTGVITPIVKTVTPIAQGGIITYSGIDITGNAGVTVQ